MCNLEGAYFMLYPDNDNEGTRTSVNKYRLGSKGGIVYRPMLRITGLYEVL